MSILDVISVAGGWEGYRVANTRTIELNGERRIEVELVPQQAKDLICSGCGQATDQVHEITKRTIRDLPILDAQTWLIVHRRRLRCPHCGPAVEHLSWLDRYSRVTRRLAESVAKLCGMLPVKHVAAFFHLSWVLKQAEVLCAGWA